jgi:cytochrome P450 family 4
MGARSVAGLLLLELTLHPYHTTQQAWLLFSAGPRNCIGQKFAELQVKIVLAKLVQKFKFSLPKDAEELMLVPAVITKSHNGVNVVMTPR